MVVKQRGRNVVLTPAGYTKDNRLVLAGATMNEEDGRYIGYTPEFNIPREWKQELLRELANNWMPPQYDREALR